MAEGWGEAGKFSQPIQIVAAVMIANGTCTTTCNHDMKYHFESPTARVSPRPAAPFRNILMARLCGGVSWVKQENSLPTVKEVVAVAVAGVVAAVLVHRQLALVAIAVK